MNKKARWKKQIGFRNTKTYMNEGDFFYAPNIRKKTELLFEPARKELWQPQMLIDPDLILLENYLQKWEAKKKSS